MLGLPLSYLLYYILPWTFGSIFVFLFSLGWAKVWASHHGEEKPTIKQVFVDDFWPDYGKLLIVLFILDSCVWWWTSGKTVNVLDIFIKFFQ